MSWTSRKGNEGEAGVRDFLNLWLSEGLGHEPAQIMESKGTQDSGDISGVPHTCIEVKNHRQPVVGPLLDNAQWKAENSARRLWFLAYKRSGYSRSRAGFWHTCTTVDGLLQYVLRAPDGSSPAFSKESVEDMCVDRADVPAIPTVELPFAWSPGFRWSINLLFRPYMKGLEDRWNSEIDTHGISERSRIVPMVISPRQNRDVGEWYVYTRLAAECRLLETVGVLPQDPSDYATQTEEEATA